MAMAPLGDAVDVEFQVAFGQHGVDAFAGLRFGGITEGQAALVQQML
jgi:hypothetical protein